VLPANCQLAVHSDQTHDACAIPAIFLQRKIPTNVERFLTAKLNAVSEKLSFLRRVCVKNEVNDIHKFIGEKFGLSGHFLDRFHMNFTLVNVLKIDSYFKALEDRK